MRDSFCRVLPIVLLGMAMTGVGQSAVPRGPAHGEMINVYGHKLHIHCVGPQDGKPVVWALSPYGIYFIHPITSEQGKLEYFDFHTGTRTPIGSVEKSIFGLALAPDGKSLLYSRNESEESDIMLIKNFQ
jgi:hypothetical protein